ncbi:MAG: glycosyltransferase family 9 protein [Pirellulaceae bacterium]
MDVAPAEKTSRVERLLIVRNDRIGDLVLTLPTIEAARRALPHARLTVLVGRYTAPLLVDHPDIDQVLVDGGGGARALAAQLRPHCFDAALLINTNTRNALAAWLARIPLRVAWAGKPAGMLLGNRRLRLHRSRPPIHEAEFARAFLGRLGVSDVPKIGVPRLTVDPAARRTAAERIRAQLGDDGPLLGIHPGNKNSAFNWPRENYVRLARELTRHGRVMVTGGPDEADLLDAFRREVDANPTDRIAYFHDFTLPEMVAALSLQDVLTVSSTGPMHLAAVLGTAVVALFSSHRAQTPMKWAPLGRKVTILQAPLAPDQSDEIPAAEGDAHMRRIGVESALAANLRAIDDASVLV